MPPPITTKSNDSEVICLTDDSRVFDEKVRVIETVNQKLFGQKWD
jgi:hypothetical protein